MTHTETAEKDLSAEDVRRLLFDIATDAYFGCRAIDGAEHNQDDPEEILAHLWKLLSRIKREAEEAAGGPTFDRFSKLEREVQS